MEKKLEFGKDYTVRYLDPVGKILRLTEAKYFGVDQKYGKLVFFKKEGEKIHRFLSKESGKNKNLQVSEAGYQEAVFHYFSVFESVGINVKDLERELILQTLEKYSLLTK